MIPRVLNLQGILGIAAAVLLLGLFLIKAGDARHWRKQSARYEQLYLAEQSSRAQTIANYRTAAETARKDDLAFAARVAASQRTITERTTHDLETRLADARAHAARLQLADRASATAERGGRTAPVPAPRQAAGAANIAAAQDGFSLADRLLATEQAIQLDELIRWVKAQAEIDAADPKSGSSPLP